MPKRVLRTNALLGAMLFCLPAWAQEAAPSKADSPEVKALIGQAKQAAGAEWAGVERFLCEEPRGASPNDPLLEPTKIFDNVYLLGRWGGEVYALTGSDGIVLIGAGGANDVETALIPGMQKLGLDPARIKDVIVDHGHADHFGGGAYLQERYGAHVYVSAEDWDMMEHPPAGRGGEKAKKGPGPVLPKHDMILKEGQPIVRGDIKVTPVFIPGHTPGAMGVIFQVKDQGKAHMAAIFGGAVLLVRAMSGDKEQYLRSIAHFKDEAKKMKVDVELKDYPLTDGQDVKLAKLKDRKKGDPNPFVVGQASYEKFLDVMRYCFEAQMALR